MLKYLPKKIILLLAGDMLLISLAYIMSFSMAYREFSLGAIQFSWAWAFIVAVYVFAFYLADLYDFSAKFSSASYLLRFIVAVSVTAGVAAAFFMLSRVGPGWRVFLLNVVFIVTLTYSWRLVLEWSLRSILRREKRILIVGAGLAGKTLYEGIKDNPIYKVVGYLDDDPRKWGLRNSPLVLGGSALLRDDAILNGLDTVVMAITHIKSPELLSCVLECKMKGVRVCDMPTFYKDATGKLPVEHVDDFWFVSNPVPGFRKGVYNVKGKRIIDVFLSVIGLTISLPFSMMAVVAVKFGPKGPVFYRQKRVGQDGAVFEVIKFRSMRNDAEKNGAVWADKEDPRVTRGGRFLRKWRLDEIPQMWNVLKGDMSVIGPRPERPEFVDRLSSRLPYYSFRHIVKPGITGWAQVNYRYGASEEDALEKLKYDLFYIKNLSPLLELHILLKTVKVVLFARGAR